MMVSRFDILLVKVSVFPKVPTGLGLRKLRTGRVTTATGIKTFQSSMESDFPVKP